MYISVSTVKNDLKEVKSILKKYNISVVSKHKQGIGIDADEDDIVNFILDICSKKDNELSLKDFLTDQVKNNMFNLKNIILSMLSSEHLVLSDTEFKNLCSIIFIKLSRSDTDENDFISSYIKEYIVQRELIMNDDKNKEKIIRAIKKFCKNLKIATSIDISNDEVFEKCLYNHINSIYKKMKLGINQYGVLPIDIRIKYPYAYELGKIAKKTIEEELDLKLDDEEISNIAVHVGGAIERAEHNQKKKVFKVIIVCVSGIGTSMLVKNKLEYLFEDKIKIVKIIPAYLIDYINAMEVDFIISTVDIKFDRVPVITVSPLLNDNEVKIIEKFMKTGKKYKEVEVKDLFDRDLFFTDLKFKTKEEVIEFMGDELLNKGVIDSDMKNSFFDREKIATTEIGNPELDSAVVFLLNRNLGGAIITNHQIHQGSSMHSGTIEHICINPDGPLCYCGNRGCLETYCSANALEQAAGMNIKDFFSLLREKKSPQLTQIWKDYLHHLAFAMKNLNLIIDAPIIISGYLAPYFLEDDIAYLTKHINVSSPFALNKEHIFVGTNGQYTPAIGGCIV